MLFNITVRRENGILETYRNVDGGIMYQVYDRDQIRKQVSSIVSIEKVPQEQIDAELSYFDKFGTGCE